MPLFPPFPTATTTVPGTVLKPAAAAAFQPSNPASTTSATLVMMGLGGTCTYTPSGTGKVLVGVTFSFATVTAAVNMTAAGRYGTVTGPATTVASGSNGGTISGIAAWANPSAGVLAVASTTGWPSSGTLWVAASGSTVAQVTYTGTAAGQFTGCAYVGGSASGTVATGGAVTGYPGNPAPVTGTRFGGSVDPLLRFSSISSTAALPAGFTDILSLTAGTQYWFDLAVSTSNASDAAAVSNVSMTFVELLS